MSQDLSKGSEAKRLDVPAFALLAKPATQVPSHSRSIRLQPNGGVEALQVVADNLSVVWATAFSKLMEPGVSRLAPIVMVVTGFDTDGRPIEIPDVPKLIDGELRRTFDARSRRGKRGEGSQPLSTQSTASTIFPDSLWTPSVPRSQLYARYLQILPRLKRDRLNRNGIYFERLIAYGRGEHGGNQLEHMINAFEANVERRSAYQAVIADPERDQKKTPYLGFPCLQHIAVDPSASAGTLSITGFYGTQYLLERGYGNLVGLGRLGRFLAFEMGLRLTRLTCIASHAPVPSIGKTRGRTLLNAVQRVLRNS